MYRTEGYVALYPVGESILDHYQNAVEAVGLQTVSPAPGFRAVQTDDHGVVTRQVSEDTLNASSFFWHSGPSTGIRLDPATFVRTRGLYDLEYTVNEVPVSHGYPIVPTSTLFRWED